MQQTEPWEFLEGTKSFLGLALSHFSHSCLSCSENEWNVTFWLPAASSTLRAFLLYPLVHPNAAHLFTIMADRYQRIYRRVITILNQYSVCKDNRHNPQKADVVTYNYIKLYKLYKKTATNSEQNSVFETTCSQTPTQDTQQEGWMHAAERQAGRQLHQHDSV